MTYKAVWCSPQSARKNWESIKSLINEFIKSNELSMHVEFVTPEILELKNEIESLRQRLSESEIRRVEMRDVLERIQIWDGLGTTWSQADLTRILRERGAMAREALAADSETPSALRDSNEQK